MSLQGSLQSTLELSVTWDGIVLVACANAVGSYPSNTFQAAFRSSVGALVLAVACMKINSVSLCDPANRDVALTPQRVDAAWLFCDFFDRVIELSFVVRAAVRRAARLVGRSLFFRVASLTGCESKSWVSSEGGTTTRCYCSFTLR